MCLLWVAAVVSTVVACCCARHLSDTALVPPYAHSRTIWRRRAHSLCSLSPCRCSEHSFLVVSSTVWLCGAVGDDHQVSVVSLLLANGADPNAKNAEGQTALFIASARGVDDVVGVLMSNGADADVEDNNGATALHVAMTCAHVPSISRVVRLLVAANGGVVTRLDGLQRNVVVNRLSKRDRTGESPLHAWARRVVRRLVTQLCFSPTLATACRGARSTPKKRRGVHCVVVVRVFGPRKVLRDLLCSWLL